MLNINDNAPSLVAETDQGSFDLSTFKGKNVVVYFYPKDMTPGCTLEAQNFRDALSDFANANTESLSTLFAQPERVVDVLRHLSVAVTAHNGVAVQCSDR